MNNKSELGAILKEIREEKKLTQEKLAEKAYINEKHYGRVERGENSPTIKIFLKICQALDEKPSNIFNMIGK